VKIYFEKPIKAQAERISIKMMKKSKELEIIYNENFVHELKCDLLLNET